MKQKTCSDAKVHLSHYKYTTYYNLLHLSFLNMSLPSFRVRLIPSSKMYFVTNIYTQMFLKWMLILICVHTPSVWVHYLSRSSNIVWGSFSIRIVLLDAMVDVIWKRLWSVVICMEMSAILFWFWNETKIIDMI